MTASATLTRSTPRLGDRMLPDAGYVCLALLAGAVLAGALFAFWKLYLPTLPTDDVFAQIHVVRVLPWP
jgi:hypothetical protein